MAPTRLSQRVRLLSNFSKEGEFLFGFRRSATRITGGHIGLRYNLLSEHSHGNEQTMSDASSVNVEKER